MSLVPRHIHRSFSRPVFIDGCNSLANAIEERSDQGRVIGMTKR